MRRRRFLTAVSVFTIFSLMPAAEMASAAGNRLRANLSGDKEVGSPGDPDGTGVARIRLRPRAKRVCFRLTWNNISQPQAAHIHKGRRDANGDVVVNLFLTPQSGNEASGCENGVRRRLIRRIKKRPGRFYVNVHTEDYPAGAIRGQLRRT